MSKLSVEAKIARANAMHEQRYDYSSTDWTGPTSSRITIMCPEHGAFQQRQNKHMAGQGCPSCSYARAWRKRQKARDVSAIAAERKAKALAVHGDQFDYSRTDWTQNNTRAKVTIGCPVHGYFEQRLFLHLRGSGCAQCAGLPADYSPKKLTPAQYEARCVSAHDGRYTYPAGTFDVPGLRSHITYICPKHGMVRQRLDAHAGGRPCPQCALHRTTPADRRARALAAHGNRYDYTETDFDAPTLGAPVTITCAAHGPFTQILEDHLRGRGCPACGKSAGGDATRTTPAVRRARCEATHGDTYDYSETDFAIPNGLHKITVQCRKHGAFEQVFNDHARGSGCPSCVMAGTSVGEAALVRTLRGFGVKVLTQYAITGTRRQRLDAFLPDQKVAIELHGLYWHSTGAPGTEGWRAADHARKHLERRRLIESRGWRYVAIYEDEWRDAPEKVTRYLAHICGASPRAMARKCRVVTVPSKTASAFYKAHHLIGSGGIGSYHCGLELDGELIGVMSFGKWTNHRGNKDNAIWALTRYATAGVAITGGAERLFAAGLKHLRLQGATSLVSYVDLDKFQGAMYTRLGFRMDQELAPDYKIVTPQKDSVRRHKTWTKRSELAKRYPDDFNPHESEYENCQRLGLFRIYDSGKLRMVREV